MNAIPFTSVIVLAMSCGCVPAAWAAADVSLVDSFEHAQAKFLDAYYGDSSAIQPALKEFESLRIRAPENPVVQAYYSAAVALQARSAFLPWKKIRYAEEGLAGLDQALRAIISTHDGETLRDIPLSLETRLVAAETFVSVPSSFKRFNQGSKLVDELEQHPAYHHGVPDRFRAAVWLVKAKVAEKNGDRVGYRQALAKASALDKDGRFGARARVLLAERG